MYKLINNKFSMIVGARRLKISDISRETGLSRTTLTQLYYDRCKYITFETLDKLCEYLKCGIGDIIEHSGECRDGRTNEANERGEEAP